MSSQELHCSVMVGVGIALTKPSPMVEQRIQLQYQQKEGREGGVTVQTFSLIRNTANML